MKKIVVASVALALGISMMPPAQAVNGEVGGAIVGGVVGGVVGSQFGRGGGKAAATIGGVLIGSFIGSQVGRSYDSQQISRAEGASQSAFQTAMNRGVRIKWHSPNLHGYIRPHRTFYSYGYRCRRFVSEVRDYDGGYRRHRGVACFNPYRGYWFIRR